MASYEARAAVREALFGNEAQAKLLANDALRLSKVKDVSYLAALALTIGGNKARGQDLVEELTKHFPKDTFVQFNYLPTLRARLMLIHNDSARAIEALSTEYSV